MAGQFDLAQEAITSQGICVRESETPINRDTKSSVLQDKSIPHFIIFCFLSVRWTHNSITELGSSCVIPYLGNI